jgi:large conductance mechanosensitive channel
MIDTSHSIGRGSIVKDISTGFKNFIARGNVVDLAVAVVLGAAFGAIVKAFIDGIIGPLISLIFGKPDISSLGNFRINHTDFLVGTVLNGVLQFVLIAAAIYFVIVLPMNKLAERRKRGLVEEPQAPAEDILLLQEIRDLLASRPSPAVRNDATPGTPGATGPTY